MCTRFYVEKEEPRLSAIIEAASRSILMERFMRQREKPAILSGEIRPTDLVPVLAPDRKGKRAVFPMKWGFALAKTKRPLVNARVETAASKPLFQESWARRRCIIPASWYFEWEHIQGKDGKAKAGSKYKIHPDGASLTWLCGLYRLEGGLPVFAVLTREPGAALSRIHDRMPLILPADRIYAWIAPDARPEELLPYALTDLRAERCGSAGGGKAAL